MKWKDLPITNDTNIPWSLLNSKEKGCHHSKIESSHVVV
jgi:hypothetical protein